jgi:hypothetical protein
VIEPRRLQLISMQKLRYRAGLSWLQEHHELARPVAGAVTSNARKLHDDIQQIRTPFETEDVRRAIRSVVEALKVGRPRPILDFEGL